MSSDETDEPKEIGFAAAGDSVGVSALAFPLDFALTGSLRRRTVVTEESAGHDATELSDSLPLSSRDGRSGDPCWSAPRKLPTLNSGTKWFSRWRAM